MVIGDEYRHAEFVRPSDARDARHTVVHGDEQIGFREVQLRLVQMHGQLDDFGRKSIAIIKTVWHEKVDVRA